MDNYLGKDIPKLGFGLMRLPMVGEDIDIEQVKKMVDLFMAKGFTYFDTAYGYGEGASERAARAALVERYDRSSFQLATKLPAWAGAKSKAEAEQMFYTSLERTGAGYFDFFLLHNLGGARSRAFDDYDIWSFLAERKREGLIRHLGFSMHDTADALDKVLTEHPEMEFVQLQINYADWESPVIQSRLCYETARRHGKPVVIMEPVKGGNLATPPAAVQDILKAARPDMSIASWGVRYAASLEGVVTVLSGMSNVGQMEDNLSYMSRFEPLSAAEREAVTKAQAELAKIDTVPCTSCRYCVKGCPQDIAIPGIFDSVNMLRLFGNADSARHGYEWETTMSGKGKASQCIECGQCEAVCPQSIPIIAELKSAAEIFE